MLKSLRQLHWSIFSLALASGVVMTGFMMLLPLLPGYSAQLGFDEYDIGLLVAAFFVGRVIFQFPLGVLSDRIGRREIMSASLFLFSISTAAYALSTLPWLMMALRLLQGIAASGFTVGSQAYINDRTGPELRGLANGITSSAINMGVIVGPLLGGTLSENFSIQTPFWVGGCLGAICFLISLAIPRVDFNQPLITKERKAPASDRVRAVINSVFCLSCLTLSLVQFLLMMSVTIFLTSAPILTAETLGWSAGEIALAFALGGAAAVISSPFLGQLSDRIGRIWVISLGLVALILEGLIAYLHPSTTLVMAAFIIGGAGTPAYFNAFYSLIGDLTLPQDRGAVTGFVGSFGEWGSIIGSSLIVPIAWRSVSVNAPMAADVLVSLLTLLLVFGLKKPLLRQARS